MVKTLQVPDNLDGATMVKWLKADGDAFVAGDPLCAFVLDGASKQLTAEGAGVLARIMARPPDDGISFGAGAPLAIVTEPGEDIGYPTSVIRSVRLLLRRTCSACGTSYPLNGLVERMVCPSCKSSEAAPVAFWTSYVFEDVVESLVTGTSAGGNVLAGKHGAGALQAASLLPLCCKCHQLLDWKLFAPVWTAAQAGTAGEFACRGCGEVHAVRAAPEWARAAQPGLLGALGEQGIDAPAAPTGKPVMFTCPQCAAPLKVDGATKRITTCGHCNVDVRLPDDLWSHFNPVAKWERWWLLFDPATPSARPDSDDGSLPEPDADVPAAEPPAKLGPSREGVIAVVIAVIVGIAITIWQFTK